MALSVIDQASVLGLLKVFSNLDLHVLSRLDVVVFNPLEDLLEPSSSSQSADQLVGNSQENADKTSTHGEVVVLESVPLRLGDDVTRSSGIDHHLVFVNFRVETCAILVTHLVGSLIKEVSSLRFNIIDKVLSVRGIAHTLEELDSLFSLVLFKVAVLLDEVLLLDRKLHILKVCQDGLLGLLVLT